LSPVQGAHCTLAIDSSPLVGVMSLRTPPKLLIVLVLLTQVAFAVFGTGFALCTEANGQASIEWTGAECCSATQDEAPRGPKPTISEQGECGGCTDRIINRGWERVETPELDLGPVRLTLLSVVELPSPRQHRAPPRVLRRSPTLGILKTIVIRC